MYQTSKGASNGDSQNKGQGIDPRPDDPTKRKVIDPFKDRRVSFRIKKATKDKPSVFVLSVRNFPPVELSHTDNINDAIAVYRESTRLDAYSVIAVQTAFASWIQGIKDQAERTARTALIQSCEIDLVNLVRSSVDALVSVEMDLTEIATVLKSGSIEKMVIEKITEKIDAEKRRAEKNDAPKK